MNREELAQFQAELEELWALERPHTDEERERFDRLAVAILAYEYETVPELPQDRRDEGVDELLNRRESVGEEERDTPGT